MTTCATDVTDWKAYRRSFELVVRKFGRVDAVFLNAGVYEPQSFWKDQEEGPYSPMEVNASAAFKGTRLAVSFTVSRDCVLKLIWELPRSTNTFVKTRQVSLLSLGRSRLSWLCRRRHCEHLMGDPRQ
mgnify:CR=1 FL=1